MTYPPYEEEWDVIKILCEGWIRVKKKAFSDNKANILNMHDNILYLSGNLVKSTSQTPHEEQSPPLSSASRVSEEILQI